MKHSFLFILGLFVAVPAFSISETNLGMVKVVKLSQRVSAADCQMHFQQKTYSSFCKIPVFEKKDTDLLVSMSSSIQKKVAQANGVTLNATLTANVEGFYWFIFDRKTAAGELLAAPSYDQVAFVMDDLIQELENREVYWKLYRLQESN